jgi:hypothetical protein
MVRLSTLPALLLASVVALSPARAEPQTPAPPAAPAASPAVETEPELPELLKLKRENIRLKAQLIQLQLQLTGLQAQTANGGLKSDAEALSKELKAACPDCDLDPETLVLTPKPKPKK